jgi:hypothetical protein
VEKGALSGAVGAYDGGDPARRHVEGDIVEGREAVVGDVVVVGVEVGDRPGCVWFSNGWAGAVGWRVWIPDWWMRAQGG